MARPTKHAQQVNLKAQIKDVAWQQISEVGLRRCRYAPLHDRSH
jgi:hypothetical protein